MKKFFKMIFDIFDSMNRARTAAMFVRMGRPDLARNIMIKDDIKV